jgi:hypothetical protein
VSNDLGRGDAAIVTPKSGISAQYKLEEVEDRRREVLQELKAFITVGGMSVGIGDAVTEEK